MLKEIAKDAATVVVLLVCTVAAVAVLFVLTYGLMLLTGRFLSWSGSPTWPGERRLRLPSPPNRSCRSPRRSTAQTPAADPRRARNGSAYSPSNVNRTQARVRSHRRARVAPSAVTSMNCHESWSNEWSSVSTVIGTRTTSRSGVYS